MKSVLRIMAGITACCLLPQLSLAQVSLNSTRVAAVDSVAVSQFYIKAFGMREVNRIDMGGRQSRSIPEFRQDRRRSQSQQGSPARHHAS